MNKGLIRRIAAVFMMLVLLMLVMSTAAASAVWNGFTAAVNGEYEWSEQEDGIPVLYVEKGKSVTVKANYIYDGSGTVNSSWSFYNWNTNASGTVAENTNSYTFTFQDPGNLNFYAWDNTGNLVHKNMYVEVYIPASEMYETNRFSVNEDRNIWFYTENIWNKENSKQYLYDKFIRDWDGDGELTADELNQNVKVKWESGVPLGRETTYAFKDTGNGYIRPGELLADLPPFKTAYDGKKLTLILENKNGDTFTAEYTLEYNETIANHLSVKSDQTVEVEEQENAMIWVAAETGTKLTFKDHSKYVGSDNPTVKYEWRFYDHDSGEFQILPATGSECEITVEKNGELSCEARYHDKDTRYSAQAYSYAYIEARLPGVRFNVVTSPAVRNNTITVTEGETVTIHTNAVSDFAGADVSFFWSIDTVNEEGELLEEVVQEGVGATFSFVADRSYDGKKVYCFGYLDEIDCEGDYLYYDLKVLPKDTNLYKTEYVSGIPASAISAELKANPALNTPEKIEATMEIQVLAQADASGMKIDTEKDQTAVYEVKLLFSEDGGKTYVEATRENWPANGIRVTLPYPAGTGMHSHNFVVAHMFSETTADHKAGDLEYPAVTNTPNGITFVVDGLSPIAVAWNEKPAVVPVTGDEATPCLWLFSMGIAAAGCIVVLAKRRQHN